VSVHFAWDGDANELLQAPSGVPPHLSANPVQKISSDDYRDIALLFVKSLDNMSDTQREAAVACAGSNAVFNALLRANNLLPKWEPFRIENAMRLFSERLREAGAGDAMLNRWTDTLRRSQHEARPRRLRRAPDSQPRRGQPRLTAECADARAVAGRAMDFLSESELSELRLPLSAVLRAVESLSKS